MPAACKPGLKVCLLVLEAFNPLTPDGGQGLLAKQKRGPYSPVIAIQERVDGSQESSGISENQMAELLFSFEFVRFHLSPLCLQRPLMGVCFVILPCMTINPDHFFLPFFFPQVVPDIACGNASSNSSAGGRLVSFEVPQNTSVK